MEKTERVNDHIADCVHVQPPPRARFFSRTPKISRVLPAGWWMIPGAIFGLCFWLALIWFFLCA